jgi:hypothetical protein
MFVSPADQKSVGLGKLRSGNRLDKEKGAARAVSELTKTAFYLPLAGFGRMESYKYNLN